MVIIARHGETIWNLEGRLQGQLDSPLTSTGLQQAKVTAELLRSQCIKDIFASPLGRALETAKIIQEVIACDIKIDKNLKEISFGDYSGLTKLQIESENPCLLNEREKAKWKFRWHGGESYENLYSRAERFVSEHFTIMNKGNILIVAHESINKMIIGCLLCLSNHEILKICQPNNILFRLNKDSDIEYRDVTKKEQVWRRYPLNTDFNSL